MKSFLSLKVNSKAVYNARTLHDIYTDIAENIVTNFRKRLYNEAFPSLLPIIT